MVGGEDCGGAEEEGGELEGGVGRGAVEQEGGGFGELAEDLGADGGFGCEDWGTRGEVCWWWTGGWRWCVGRWFAGGELGSGGVCWFGGWFCLADEAGGGVAEGSTGEPLEDGGRLGWRGGYDRAPECGWEAEEEIQWYSHSG